MVMRVVTVILKDDHNGHGDDLGDYGDDDLGDDDGDDLGEDDDDDQAGVCCGSLL